MNLLLYTESRIALNRLTDDTPGPVELLTLVLDPSHPLPDSLFEELGYFGALDENDDPEEESFDELYHWFTEPVLSR